jgi:hypothetical protein
VTLSTHRAAGVNKIERNSPRSIERVTTGGFANRGQLTAESDFQYSYAPLFRFLAVHLIGLRV